MVTPPSGWTDNITTYGPGDGFGIQFVASSSAYDIAPGQFMEFNFETLDTPAYMAGTSPYGRATPPYTPVGTSMVYEQIFNPGVGFVVVPDASVPEPSALGLLLLGSLGFWLARSRRLQRRFQSSAS
jgi:hypothetical protein